jgi:hypothetical protein
MPAAFAMRTASAVGAETATASGTPIAAAFWIISTDTRLVFAPAAAQTIGVGKAAATA